MELVKNRFKAVFEALNMSANAFALSHGFNAPTMYGFVKGARSPGFETLVSICAAEPKISAEYLLRGEGEPLLTKRQAANLTTVEELKSFKENIDKFIEQRIAELEN